MKSATTCTLPVRTRKGVFAARYSAKGLAGLEFPRANASPRAKSGPAIPWPVQRWHRQTSAALARALAGNSPRRLPPLDDSSGTDFQRRVWAALRRIAPGQTRSYSQIARAIGKPRAVRAVGSACGANSIPIFIPCHRVLAANGGLGGFSAGLPWKRTLLESEGIQRIGRR
jgi:O-6-methylguanine DNA methyltransferase